MTLRHGAVELRPLRLDDVGEWSRWRRRDRRDVRRGEFRSPWPYRLMNSTVMLGRLARLLLQAADEGRLRPWVITYDGHFAGRFALFHVTEHDAEMGGWVASRATGRGVYTIASALAVDHAFATGLCRVYVHVREGNPASLRAADKLGLRPEARFTRREGDGRRRQWTRLAVHARDLPGGALGRVR